MESKGVVCRLNSRSAVVMTSDLEFVEIRRRPEMEIGREVRFTGADRIERRRLSRAVALAAALTVLLLAAVFIQPSVGPETPPVYAYVSVEVNPGVELALDRELTVIAAEALNADGAAVLAELELEGLPVPEAVAALTRAWREAGYLGAGPANLVVTTTFLEDEDEENSRRLQARLMECTRQELRAAAAATEVYVLDCDSATRDRAREMNLSPAHYVIWQQARNEGVDIDSEEVRAAGLRKALEARGRDFGAAVAAAAAMCARAGPEREADDESGTARPWTEPAAVDPVPKSTGGGKGRPENPGLPVLPEKPVMEESDSSEREHLLPPFGGGAGKRADPGDDKHPGNGDQDDSRVSPPVKKNGWGQR